MLNTVSFSFPTQKRSYSDKDFEWKRGCIDAIISEAYTSGINRRSSVNNKIRNYNLFNNKIDQTHFASVINPLKLSASKLEGFNFPTSIQPYDIISPYFNLLFGEETKRMFEPFVIAINQDAVSEKQSLKKKEIMSILQEILVSDQEDPEKQKELSKFQNYTPKMMRERISNHLLKYYSKRNNITKIYSECFKDALLAGEEIVDVSRVGTGVNVRKVNPLEVFFVLENNSDEVDSCDKIYEVTYQTVSSIVDEFYEYLTSDQITELENIERGVPTKPAEPYMLGISEVDSIYTFTELNNKNGIPVHRIRWKSKKKVGIHHFLDENNQEQEELVEETFKVNKKDPSAYVEWFWISEYWEGVRISTDIYLENLIRPRRQQFRSIDNLSSCKSGYVGTIYSCTNSQSTSLMDRLFPWVALYLTIWYRTEIALAKYQGKMVEIDLSLMPAGFDEEKWIYYGQQMGILFIDRFNEENKTERGIPGGNNNTAKNQVIDLETSAYIIQHLKLLEFIDERIQNTAGITRQRLGSITSSELVGNTERAVTQSSHITEPYFFLHENFKLRICDAIIEVAKECLDGKSAAMQYVTDDLEQIVFQVDGDDFNNSDYGTFVTNTAKDAEALEAARNLLQAGIQNDKISFSEAVNVLRSTSISDIKASLIEAENNQAERQSQAEQQQLQSTQMIEDKRLAFEHEKLDREDARLDKELDNKLQVAEINALSFSKDTDADNDGVPDVIEVAKQYLDENKHLADVALEKKKLDQEQQKIDYQKKKDAQDIQMRDKEMKSKERLKKFEIRNKPKPKPAKKKV